MWQVNPRKAELDFLERQAQAKGRETVKTTDDDLRWSLRFDEHEHPPERPARPLTKFLVAALAVLFVALTLYLAL